MNEKMLIPPNVRCCVEDSLGNCVFVGDTVMASNGEHYVVEALEIVDSGAWILTTNGIHLIPRLTELMG